MLTHYRITITNTGLTTGTSAGFLDDLSPKNYDPRPTTDAASRDKLFANLRWKALIDLIGTEMTAVTEIQSIDKPGADADTPASEIAFTAIFARDEDLVTRTGNLTGADALQSVIATSLTNTHRGRYVVYRPENTLSVEELAEYVEIGPLAGNITAALGMVTVVKFSPE